MLQPSWAAALLALYITALVGLITALASLLLLLLHRLPARLEEVGLHACMCAHTHTHVRAGVAILVRVPAHAQTTHPIPLHPTTIHWARVLLHAARCLS